MPNGAGTPDCLIRPQCQFDILKKWPDHLDPLMHELYNILVDCEALGDFNDAVETAIKTGVEDLKELCISNASEYVCYMSDFLRWAPTEKHDGKWVYKHIVVFYWVFNINPLGSNTKVQTPIVPQSAGQPQKPVTKWLVDYAIKMGKFMSTKESWSQAALDSFKTADKYHVEWYQGPWSTFNEFFSRHLKEKRHVDGQGDDHVVVSPADCTYSTPFVPVQENSDINVKGMLWNIDELLSDSDVLTGGEFAGGSFVHAFLAPFDYHRQHAPVSGRVREAKVVQGQCYLQVVVEPSPNKGGAPRLRPVRPIPSPADPDLFEPEALDGTGYQFLQTRGIIIIENPNLGLVACLPIGMAQVSSVKTTLIAGPGDEGQFVEKGDEISWFELGGSDCIMVFQKKANVSLTVDPAKAKHMYQGQQVIRADYGLKNY